MIKLTRIQLSELLQCTAEILQTDKTETTMAISDTLDARISIIESRLLVVLHDSGSPTVLLLVDIADCI